MPEGQSGIPLTKPLRASATPGKLVSAPNRGGEGEVDRKG